MLSWSLFRRRPTPAPPPSWDRLLDEVPVVRDLPRPRRDALLAWTAGFIPSVEWVGCGGLEVTEEMKVVVAAQAGVLVLERPERDLYRDVSSILIYPSAVVRPPRPMGFFETPRANAEQPTALLGEAMLHGPVVLAWDTVEDEARARRATNLVLHEFAHKLDMATGVIDGAPPLPTRHEAARWAGVFASAYARHVEAVAAGVPTVLRPYGATSPAEFYAVATEAYFLTPGALAEEHPALAAVLASYYRAHRAPLAVAHTDDGFAFVAPGTSRYSDLAR